MNRTNLLFASVSGALVVALIVACGSSDSEFGPQGFDAGPQGFTDGSVTGDAHPDGGDPYANDPPAPNCGPPQTDIAACCMNPPAPTPVGGTEQCPDDKNKPGCACSTPGATAACWTGLRKNRGLGVCKDGTTTCIQKDEVTYEWGTCDGEVLPTAGATKGKDACGCFSAGAWKLANLSPCLERYTADTAGPYYAVSTIPDPDGGANAVCPDPGGGPPVPKPAGDWTTDSLNVDCAGHFKLCYEIKAGDFNNPKASDCSMSGKLCVEGDYPTENTDTPFPPLPSWNSSDSTCATQFYTSGGYGEMSVIGESVRCEAIDDGSGSSYVFHRVQYCPFSCNDPANASNPECQNCQQGGSGNF